MKSLNIKIITAITIFLFYLIPARADVTINFPKAVGDDNWMWSVIATINNNTEYPLKLLYHHAPWNVVLNSPFGGWGVPKVIPAEDDTTDGTFYVSAYMFQTIHFTVAYNVEDSDGGTLGQCFLSLREKYKYHGAPELEEGYCTGNFHMSTVSKGDRYYVVAVSENP